MFLEILKAILMGIVEGITEWLPISSTGHMILVEQVVKFNASEEFMSMFRVVIQLGAILAVVVLFWNKLWPFGLRHGRVCSKPAVWQLWFKVVAATIPVLIISPLDDWFETRFYNYITVAAMLILYGVLFILVENRRTAPHVNRLEQITYREAFIVGVWQMLAIIPGTSRSGATIVGGLLLGLSRACVAEFTFFLAIPVMAGASLLKVVKFVLSGAAMTGTEVAVLVVGCVVAFVVSLVAIRFLMDYVKRHNFKFFGLYRIVLGAIVLPVPPLRHILFSYIPIAEIRRIRASTVALSRYVNGRRWIRTTEGSASRFTVCPLWPLGNSPMAFSSSNDDTIEKRKNQYFF